MRDRVRNSLLVFILFSLCLHFGVWTSLKLKWTTRQPAEKTKIEFTVLDQSQVQKQMQIVESPEKPVNDEVSEDAQFLSAHNQRVVKETRAKQNGDFRNTSGKGGPLPTISHLRPVFDPSALRELKPATAAGGGPASQTNDYLKNAEPSLETLLNTREFVYFTYYQRIRSQIRQFWEPSIRAKVKKIFNEGRSIASEKDHVTRVIIVLNKQGELMRVQVIGQSGVKDLDDAAVEAFRAAEPFPNPPKGIVEKDGTIKINWDFILEAGLDAFEKPQRYARSAW